MTSRFRALACLFVAILICGVCFFLHDVPIKPAKSDQIYLIEVSPVAPYSKGLSIDRIGYYCRYPEFPEHWMNCYNKRGSASNHQALTLRDFTRLTDSVDRWLLIKPGGGAPFYAQADLDTMGGVTVALSFFDALNSIHGSLLSINIAQHESEISLARKELDSIKEKLNQNDVDKMRKLQNRIDDLDSRILQMKKLLGSEMFHVSSVEKERKAKRVSKVLMFNNGQQVYMGWSGER